jgi:hypothetical protein
MMRIPGEQDFLDLTLDLQERGAHARVLGLPEADCTGLLTLATGFDDPDVLIEDFCHFGWVIEDAFRAAGLDRYVVSSGGLMVIRTEELAVTT